MSDIKLFRIYANSVLQVEGQPRTVGHVERMTLSQLATGVWQEVGRARG